MKTSTPKGISKADFQAAQQKKDSIDFINHTNQGLQTLSTAIISLSIQNEKVMAKTGSDHKALLIEFENLKEVVLKSIQKMDQRLGDFESKIANLLNHFNILSEEISLKYLPKQEFYDSHVLDVKNVEDLQREMIERKDYMSFAISTLKSQFKQDLEVVKKELTLKPQEVDPIKQQLDERFKILKIDLDGLMKEIELLKKAISYDQKKFENVYTLIERLKEGKQ